MARKVIVRMVDDLDGGDADETVEFGLDGVSYTIDLSAKNAETLRSVFAPYIAVAQRVSPPRGRRANGAGVGDRSELKAIREWARANGYQVSDRGRIPANIINAYQSAKNGKK